MHELSSFFSGFFDWSVTSNLLTYTFVQHALIAAVLLGLISGLIGPVSYTHLTLPTKA